MVEVTAVVLAEYHNFGIILQMSLRTLVT